MPRDRHQRGYVRLVGKGVKKWKGFFHLYIAGDDGQERIRNTSRILGTKAEFPTKWQAEEKLTTIIEKESGGIPARPDPETTFTWFWHQRYLPQVEGKWSKAQQQAVAYVMQSHVLPEFGNTKLEDLSKFHLQTFLNKLAKRYSESVVDKAYTYLRAAFEEALENDYLSKNPMRKVEMPKTRKPCKRHLSPEEIQRLFRKLKGKDHLILHCFLVGALRPGETFALRWEDIEPGRIRIDERVYRNELGDPKTETSNGYVAIPTSLERELALWKQQCERTEPKDFVFEARHHGKPMDGRSYLRRHLKLVANELGIHGFTYQALRRTVATRCTTARLAL